jgi:hypothetical protein
VFASAACRANRRELASCAFAAVRPWADVGGAAVPPTHVPTGSYCVREAEANVNKQQQLVLPTAYNGELVCNPT